MKKKVFVSILVLGFIFGFAQKSFALNAYDQCMVEHEAIVNGSYDPFLATPLIPEPKALPMVGYVQSLSEPYKSQKVAYDNAMAAHLKSIQDAIDKQNIALDEKLSECNSLLVQQSDSSPSDPAQNPPIIGSVPVVNTGSTQNNSAAVINQLNIQVNDYKKELSDVQQQLADAKLALANKTSSVSVKEVTLPCPAITTQKDIVAPTDSKKETPVVEKTTIESADTSSDTSIPSEQKKGLINWITHWFK